MVAALAGLLHRAVTAETVPAVWREAAREAQPGPHTRLGKGWPGVSSTHQGLGTWPWALGHMTLPRDEPDAPSQHLQYPPNSTLLLALTPSPLLSCLECPSPAASLPPGLSPSSGLGPSPRAHSLPLPSATWVTYPPPSWSPSPNRQHSSCPPLGSALSASLQGTHQEGMTTSRPCPCA